MTLRIGHLLQVRGWPICRRGYRVVGVGVLWPRGWRVVAPGAS